MPHNCASRRTPQPLVTRSAEGAIAWGHVRDHDRGEEARADRQARPELDPEDDGLGDAVHHRADDDAHRARRRPRSRTCCCDASRRR